MKSVILIFLLPILSLAQEMPMICLNSGACYQGSWLISNAGNQYASFQGIRYAEAPIGNLRFRPPKLFQSGEALWDVSQESEIACPQIPEFGFDSSLKGQEDCLFLNIYVPKAALDNNELLTVMVWIHGGSLITGSNNFASQGPQDYMDRNVIIVTINYRLGPLGFLSLGTEEVSGNIGFLDQNLALQWVQENIEAFHGDSKSVTLFGESAGALSVAVQFLSPMSQGLFQRIILQSCTTEAPSWGVMNASLAMQYGSMFTEQLQCSEAPNVLECLQNKSMEEIINLTYTLVQGNAWQAVPDGKFLMDDPTNLLEQGQFDPNIEVIVSTTKDEGILYCFDQLEDPSKWQEYQEDFERIVPRILFDIPFINEPTEADVAKSYQVIEHYIGSVDNLNENHLQGIFDVFTDAGFLYGIYKTTNYLLQQNVKVYQAILTYQGQYSLTNYLGLGKYGVCHADDLFYMWTLKDLPLNSEDTKVRNVMTDAWANFAKYGDPTPPGSVSTWLPVDPFHGRRQFWNISGAIPHMTFNQDIDDRMFFWNQLLHN